MAKILSLGFGAALLAAAMAYPFDGTWLAALLLAYAALVLWNGPAWLYLLPALLPVLDVTPWTGWFYLEEIDLLLLITATLGYWRLRALPVAARLPRAVLVGVLLVSMAVAIGFYRGISPLAAPDINAFSSYLSPYNALRIVKSWCWAIILLPLLARDAGAGLVRIRSHFIPGMLTGLALVCLFAVGERIAFPGLLNLASDYRTSAPFSAMHTGGAALDGYLALCFPLIALWLMQARAPLERASAVVLLALATYAGLTTFSRAVFLAYAGAAVVVLALTLAPALRRRALAPLPVAIALVLFAVAAWVLATVFPSSGYRGLAAALAVLIAAMALTTRRIGGAQLLRAAVIGAALEAGLAFLLSSGAPAQSGLLKAPYLLFIISGAVFAFASARPGTSASLPALTAFFGLLVNMLWIAHHWNGAAGLAGMMGVVALAAGALALHAARRRGPWRPGNTEIAAGLACAVLLGLAIPVSSSYYAGERFGAAAGDLQTRARHWRNALQMMDKDIGTTLFGMGLGRYPASYFWRNPARELPGTLATVEDGANRFIRLTAPVYAQGYGELIRVLQRLPVAPRTAYLFALDIRRTDARALVVAKLCERQMLYPQNCVALPLRLAPPDSRWHRYLVPFQSAALDGTSWPISLPVQLEIALAGNTSVDIDNVSLVEIASGAQLIRNGSFARAIDHWFFSSDRHHLPWHIKNLWLNQYFEQGWFGLLAFTLLLVAAFAVLIKQALRGQASAAVYAAALTGFLIVGQFDSLVDVPRIALIFFLFLFAAVLAPAPAARARHRRRRLKDGSVAPADEAIRDAGLVPDRKEVGIE